MANFDLLMRSLAFIEEHLEDSIQTEEIAQACFASKSALEKVFKYTIHFSVHDYMIRRRMTKAARTMLDKPNYSLLDIAVSYGYSSHEAFTRAFSSVWNCTPSEYREQKKGKLHTAELFPRITGLMQIEGETFMRRKCDISELYDFLKSRADCWCVICDIYHLIPINDISRKAGDLAISESLRRMESVCGDEDVVFRIGGDEFVLLTSSSDRAYAEGLQQRILAMNGQLIPYKEAEVPLKLYADLVKVDAGNLKYAELFPKLVISQEKKEEVL